MVDCQKGVESRERARNSGWPAGWWQFVELGIQDGLLFGGSLWSRWRGQGIQDMMLVRLFGLCHNINIKI